MAVKGSRDGLNPMSNKGFQRVEPLVTVKNIRDRYLFGVHIRDQVSDKELPDSVIQDYINAAVSMLEHYLDIAITPVKGFYEDRDYLFNEYEDWGYFQLNNFPVIQIQKLEMIYFRDEDGTPQTVQTIPASWLRLQPHDGILRLIPNSRFPANLQIGASGSYFPEVLRTQMVPHLWRITYDYGFCDGAIPVILNEAIGILASIRALITAGHLILGAGIAGTSISLDGLSQSISTTQSAENSGYSASIRDYSEKLFGKTANDPFAILTILKEYYKGAQMNLI